MGFQLGLEKHHWSIRSMYTSTLLGAMDPMGPRLPPSRGTWGVLFVAGPSGGCFFLGRQQRFWGIFLGDLVELFGAKKQPFQGDLTVSECRLMPRKQEFPSDSMVSCWKRHVYGGFTWTHHHGIITVSHFQLHPLCLHDLFTIVFQMFPVHIDWNDGGGSGSHSIQTALFSANLAGWNTFSENIIIFFYILLLDISVRRGPNLFRPIPASTPKGGVRSRLAPHFSLTGPTEVASRNSWYSKYSIVCQPIFLIPIKCRGFHTHHIPIFCSQFSWRSQKDSCTKRPQDDT